MRALSFLAVVLAASAASAQVLGDVARQEAERRRAVKVTGKVYTNDQLKPDPSSAAQPAAPASTPESGKADAPGTKSDATKGDAARPEPGKGDAAKADGAAGGPAPSDEKAWRAKVQGTREALSRAQMFADALQSRVNGLSADFTARDDPAQRAAVAADRQKSLDELERVKKEIQQHTKALTEIQDEGRKAGVPAGWLR